MSPDVAGEVMEQLEWERLASGVFRRVCKGWRDAHDQCVRYLSVNARLSADALMMMWTPRFNSSRMMMNRFILRFQRVQRIDIRGSGDPPHRPFVGDADKWLWALDGLTALTSLDLHGCRQVSDDGLRELAGFTALTYLNLVGCHQVSDIGLQALANLTVLITLDLSDCDRACQTTGCRHWPASLPTPTYICRAIIKCQTIGGGHWPASLP